MTEGRIWTAGLLAILLLSLLCCRAHYTPDPVQAAAPSLTSPAATVTAPAVTAPATATAPASAAATAPVAAAAVALIEPSLQMDIDSKGLVILRGTVADKATKDAILARTARIYGATRYIEGIQIAPIHSHDWFNSLAANFPPDLRNVGRAQAFSQTGGVVLSGEVADNDTKSKLLATAVSQFGAQVSVTDRLSAPAAASVAAAAAAPAPANAAPATPAAPAAKDSGATSTTSAAAKPAAGDRVFFVTSSAHLTPKARVTLRKLAAAIKQGNAQSKYSIVGFTDSRGPDQFNNQLSERRAKAVSAYLTRLGISSDRISVDAKGETDPAGDNSTIEGRRLNRRVEVRLIQ